MGGILVQESRDKCIESMVEYFIDIELRIQSTFECRGRPSWAEAMCDCIERQP